jgi:hypothetical protein
MSAANESMFRKTGSHHFLQPPGVDQRSDFVARVHHQAEPKKAQVAASSKSTEDDRSASRASASRAHRFMNPQLVELPAASANRLGY